MMIGYARVSTDDQDLALQLDALRGAGCEEIFQDTGSGADGGRKGLAAGLSRCAAGDVLVVWKLEGSGGPCLPSWASRGFTGQGCGPEGSDRRGGDNRHDKAGSSLACSPHWRSSSAN
jgi:Resolvase, N terminal domain